MLKLQQKAGIWSHLDCMMRFQAGVEGKSGTFSVITSVVPRSLLMNIQEFAVDAE
jgi:hypothetical protein